MILLVLSVLVVVGSFGPWATVLFFSVSGTEGDGVITLIIGIIAAVLSGLSMGSPSNVKFVILGVLHSIAMVIGIYDWSELESVIDEANGAGVGASVGWGLVMMTLCAGAGALTSFASLRARSSIPLPPEEREVLPQIAPYVPVQPPPGYRGPTRTDSDRNDD